MLYQCQSSRPAKLLQSGSKQQHWKFMRRRAFHNHLLDHKSPKLKRHLKTKAVVDERDAENVSLMLPYARLLKNVY